LHRRRASETFGPRERGAPEPDLRPLLSIIEDAEAPAGLLELARRYNREIIADRGMDTEAQVLEVVRDMLASPFATAGLSSMSVIRTRTAWLSQRRGLNGLGGFMMLRGCSG